MTTTTSSTTTQGRISSSSVVKKVTFSQPSTSSKAPGDTKEKDETRKRSKKRQISNEKRQQRQSVTKPLLESLKMKKGKESKKVTTTRAKATVDGVAEDEKEVAVDQEVVEDDDGDHRCPDYFGVKSYLHHFYETVSVKNPDLYEELEGGADYDGYLMRPRKPHCRSLWWKVAVCCGVNLLVVGVVVILVGYLVPRRQVVIGYQNELEVIDRSALRYNYNLDACKLIGLIVFCVGGTVVAIALLFPSFLYSYFDEDWNLQAEPPPPPNPPLDDLDENFEPMSPTERKVPATEQVTWIQPNWEEKEEEEKKKNDE